MAFGTFAETQWQVLILSTLKLSTQHGYKNVLRKHVLPYWSDWRLRDIGRLDIQQWVAAKFRQREGWQTVRNSWVLLSAILETSVEYGALESNPARGVKFPQKALKDAPAIVAGIDFVRLLDQLDEPYRTMVSLIAATGLRVGELWRSGGALWTSIKGRYRCGSRSTKGDSSRQKRCGRDAPFRSVRTRSRRSKRIASGCHGRRLTTSSSAIAMAIRCVSPNSCRMFYNPPQRRWASGA